MTDMQELVILIDAIKNLFAFAMVWITVFLIIYAFHDHAVLKEIRKLRKLFEEKEKEKGQRTPLGGRSYDP